jgi:hypothetical protein
VLTPEQLSMLCEGIDGACQSALMYREKRRHAYGCQNARAHGAIFFGVNFISHVSNLQDVINSLLQHSRAVLVWLNYQQNCQAKF